MPLGYLRRDLLINRCHRQDGWEMVGILEDVGLLIDFIGNDIITGRHLQTCNELSIGFNHHVKMKNGVHRVELS